MSISYLSKDDFNNFKHSIVFYGNFRKKMLRKYENLFKEKTLVILMQNSSDKDVDCRKYKNITIKRFTLQVLDFQARYDSDMYSYLLIDEVYSDLCKQNKIPNLLLTKIYNDSQISLAYKRFVIEKIKELFVLNNLLFSLTQRKISHDVCMDYRIHEIFMWMVGKNREKNFQYIDKCNISYNGNMYLNSFLSRVTWSFKIIFIPLYILSKIRHVEFFNKNKKHVKAIVSVFQQDIKLSSNSTKLSVDWPVDGRNLSKTNILFVSENALSREYKERINSFSYEYEDLSNFNKTSISFIFLKLLYPWLTTLASFWKDVLHASPILLEVSARGLYVFYQWSLFSIYWKADKFLCYQGTSIRSIFRNIVLKKNGCLTWRYDHSFNFNHNIYIDNGKDYNLTVDSSFLNYTYEMHWGALNTNAFMNSNSFSENHLTIKPIWNYVFSDLSKMEILKSLSIRISEKTKVVAVFNSSINYGSYSDVNSHCGFIVALSKLLSVNSLQNNDIILLVKSKYPLANYYKMKNDILTKNVQKLLRDDRVVEVDVSVSATAIIKVSDIAVSMAYTSTGVEALMLNKRSVYFDYNLAYPESIFRQFENMTTKSSDEFVTAIEYWLEMEEPLFKRFLDKTFYPFYYGQCQVEQNPLTLFRR